MDQMPTLLLDLWNLFNQKNDICTSDIWRMRCKQYRLVVIVNVLSWAHTENIFFIQLADVMLLSMCHRRNQVFACLFNQLDMISQIKPYFAHVC